MSSELLVPSAPALWNLDQHHEELIMHRDKNNKKFLRDDGVIVGIFSTKIHHELEPGSFVEQEEKFRPHIGTAMIAEYRPVSVIAQSDGIVLLDNKSKKGIHWVLTPKANSGMDSAVTVENGLEWEYRITATGVKVTALVGERRGVKRYSFRYRIRGDNRDLVDREDGGLDGGVFLIQRAEVTGADGRVYPCSPWAMDGGRSVSFIFDDTGLPDGAFPYIIDPTTNFPSAGSQDSYTQQASSSSWIPSSPGAVNYTSDSVKWMSQMYNEGEGFAVNMAGARWDTSSITALATVAAATLNVKSYNGSYGDSHGVVGDYGLNAGTYATNAGWTNNVGSTAFAETYTYGPDGAAYAITLLNLNNINKTGITYMRTGITNKYWPSGWPTGYNYANWYGFSSSASLRPFLAITYTLPSSGYHMMI